MGEEQFSENKPYAKRPIGQWSLSLSHIASLN